MIYEDDILYHHGTKGQKWGVRRAEKRGAKLDAKNAKKDAKEEADWQKYRKKEHDAGIYNQQHNRAGVRKFNGKNVKFDSTSLTFRQHPILKSAKWGFQATGTPQGALVQVITDKFQHNRNVTAAMKRQLGSSYLALSHGDKIKIKKVIKRYSGVKVMTDGKTARAD